MEETFLGKEYVMEQSVVRETIANITTLPQPSVAADPVPYLSVVVPIYNEEESIPRLHECLTDELDQLGVRYEIIAIDDGSRDRSFELLRDIAHTDERLHVVRFRRNFGQTPAFAAASTGLAAILLSLLMQIYKTIRQISHDCWQSLTMGMMSSVAGASDVKILSGVGACLHALRIA